MDVLAIEGEISIHALLAESDVFHFVHAHNVIGFLSTLSLRRATPIQRRFRPTGPYFYPRSPCGERRLRYRALSARLRFLSTLSLRRATRQKPTEAATWDISIHALLAESDEHATIKTIQDNTISIHALLAESDQAFTVVLKTSDHFYPRSPCGERLTSFNLNNSQTDFYPRSPCGERRDYPA